MYRILIVDDEKIERRGIKFLLANLDMELDIAEAVNGKEALTYLSENKVDILFTDIKMPFMDGIELIKNVETEKHNMKIIIFSGYEEFEYAKFAAKMGVRDYILKPINPEEFEETIKRIVKEIDDENTLKEKEDRNLKILKNELIQNLINGEKFSQVENQAKGIIDFSYLKSYNMMFLIDYDGKKADEDRVKNLFKEKLNLKFEIAKINEEQMLMIFNADNYLNNIYKFAERIYSIVFKDNNENGYIIIGNKFNTPDEIFINKKRVQILAEKKFYTKDVYILEGKAEDDKNIIINIDDNKILKEVIKDIKIKNIEGIRESFNKLCDAVWGNAEFSPVYIKFIFSNLLKLFHENLRDADKEELKRDINRIYTETDLSAVIRIVNLYIERIYKEFSDNTSVVHKEIELIKQYIYKNYGSELSVEILAEKVCLAPNYLSNIFKKETGENLTKFIKAYRMNKAKDMLDETYEKVVDISNAVGYPNVSYFCQSFREYFGISPQKYRSNGSVNEKNDKVF